MPTAPATPMLAVSGELPTGEGWLYEFKWDGIRTLAEWDGAKLRLWSRNGNDVTAGYPELAGLGGDLGSEPALVDGEIVALDEQGRPSFGLLQQRMHVRGAAVARLVGEVPVHLFVFDILRFAGRDLTALPLVERRRVLDDLDLEGPSWRVPPSFVDDGSVVLDAASRLGLEGVVAKRLTSTYDAGRRSEAWRKVKLIHRDEFVVAGFTEGTGRRQSTLGALLLGGRDHEGRFAYVGSVGTGMSDAELERLRAELDAAVAPGDPFEAGPPRPVATFVRPRIVVEVEYSGWTRDRALRHPSYVGARTDRPAAEVELPQSTSGPPVGR